MHKNTPQIGNDGEFSEDVPAYVLRGPGKQKRWHKRWLSPQTLQLLFVTFGLFGSSALVLFILVQAIQAVGEPLFSAPPIAATPITENAADCGLSEIAAMRDILVFRTEGSIFAATPEGEILCRANDDWDQIPVLAPDHRQIATLDADTLIVQSIDSQASFHIDLDIDASHLAWSPNSDLLVFQSNNSRYQSIYVINPQQGIDSLREVAHGFYPNWIDNENVVFWHYAGAQQTYGVHKVQVDSLLVDEITCCGNRTPSNPAEIITSGEDTIYIITQSASFNDPYLDKRVLFVDHDYQVKSPYGLYFASIINRFNNGRYFIMIYDQLDGEESTILYLDEPIYAIAWW